MIFTYLLISALPHLQQWTNTGAQLARFSIPALSTTFHSKTTASMINTNSAKQNVRKFQFQKEAPKSFVPKQQLDFKINHGFAAKAIKPKAIK